MAEAHQEHLVKGRITRIYPFKERILFHLEGDAAPYGYEGSDYNFLCALLFRFCCFRCFFLFALCDCSCF